MELTAEQRRVVEHAGGPLSIVGGDGHGKTTALLARYRDLVTRHRPSTVLVICSSRYAADRFRDVVRPHLAGGFDALPITTWYGVAFDLISRAGGRVLLLSAAEQRAIVRRLLEGESAPDWPQFGKFLGRDAFVDEVAAALLEYQACPAGNEELSGPWRELGRFAERYAVFLAERGRTDRSGLLAAAFRLPIAGAFAHLLVDDYDGSDTGVRRLLAALAGPSHDVTVVQSGTHDALPWPARHVVLTQPFRRAAERHLITCGHPSTEPEAVTGELLGARAEGVGWSEMAVLVRRPQLHGRRIARSLVRHGIPVAPGAGIGAGSHDPAVAAILDMLRWAGAPNEPAFLDRLLHSPVAGLGHEGLVALRDELTAQVPEVSPGELAFLVRERALGHLLSGQEGDDVALDAVVAFVDWLERQADEDPAARLADLLATVEAGGLDSDRWRLSAADAAGDAVTVASVTSAVGRQWHTVVLAGCVEGELPRISGRAPLFDPALLEGTVPLSPAERRQRSLTEERRLFALACSRATGRLVGTAAPQPGVLVSRFVEGWAPRPARPLDVAGPARPLDVLGPPPPPATPTAGGAAVFPDGRLVLSASQLDTYDDCPLRYAYRYGLMVRDEAGAPAALGSLVHQVLAEFLNPDRPPGAAPRSRDALLALATERWSDDIALYRPQVEECRRDYFQMLEDWWAAEGEGPMAPEVLAVEHGFDVEVGDLRLVGAIDRVDRATGGEGIRIVDYKTGRREPRPGAIPDDLQLAVYHLAATRDPELAALGPPVELRLLYLRSMHTFQQAVMDDHAQATEARVKEAAAAIRSERFEPSVHASCRNCSFHRLCPLQPEGREVGAR